MKDEGRKDVVRVFGRWSLTNEERWLEKMAGRGWFLYEVAAPCVYRFEKGEPRKLRYAVEYAGKSDDVAEDIAVFCSDGWDYLGRFGKRRYYTAEDTALAHPSSVSAEEDLCLHTTQANLTTLLLLNVPGTVYCLLYLFLFLGEGGFLFSEIFLPESGASKVYLLGAVLGVAAGIYFVRRIMRIKKRLRTLGFRKGEPS
jgi:hypothetical protein